MLQYFIIQSLRFHDTHIAKINVSTLDVDTHIFITNQIQQYCLDYIREKLRLSDIASFVNFSQSQICASFKKVTEESIFSYINNLKIEEAKKLLSETTLPIKSIALNLSFSDKKYFNTFFKKKVGLAPSLFRQKNKTVNAKRAK